MVKMNAQRREDAMGLVRAICSILYNMMISPAPALILRSFSGQISRYH